MNAADIETQIKTLRARIKSLRGQLAEIERTNELQRRVSRDEEKRIARQAHDDISERALWLVASGMTLAAAAAELGCSKHTLPDRIYHVWKLRYNEHFRSSYSHRICALRANPPPKNLP